MKKFWAVMVARNKEFLRDRASLGWNLFFPVLVLFGFSFISSGNQATFKVAVLGGVPTSADRAEFYDTHHVQFVAVGSLDEAMRKVGQHRFDMLIDPGESPRYWINSSSSKGYLVERVLWGSSPPGHYHKETVEGREIRYIDWLIPGLLSMNMTFSAMFGVGFVMVRYRKMGVLRRLKATPLSAFQFLSAQVASRLILIVGATVLVYVGSNLILHFQMVGSYFSLISIFLLGSVCMVSLGLLMAARTASEELAGGILNLVTMPMMFLSGVWFSLDGAPGWVRGIAQALPLTHINDAARAVMTDGASFAAVLPDVAVLAAMTMVFLALGAWTFRWE